MTDFEFDLKAFLARRDRIVEKAIEEELDKHGRVYSRGVRDGAKLDVSIFAIRQVLRRMEAEGKLVSENVVPTKEDGRSGGLARRYYRRKDRS